MKLYRFQNMGLFIAKVIFTLTIMSGLVQIVLSIPTQSRLSSLLVLVLAGIVGVIIVLLGIIKLKILKREECQHLPLMDKLMKEK